jgi:solute carrier family 25 (adenine nucleotide translocator) protein 4/5/6/31
MVSGCLSGAVSKTFIAPVDRVKLLLQLQPTVPPGRSPGYEGPLEAVRETLRTEGWRSFWRGNAPAVLRHVGTTAFTFTVKDRFRVRCVPAAAPPSSSPAAPSSPSSRPPPPAPSSSPRRQHLLASLASGGLAGGLSTLLFYPFDFARTRLALDLGRSRARQYPGGTRDVLGRIVAADGPGGIYKGVGVALFGSVLFRALHFGLYDFAKAELSPPGEPPSLSRRFGIAQAVSLAAGTSCYPLDSVRRRLMMQSGLPKPAYSTALDCARHVLREEGPRGFFLGLTPNLLRSVGGAVLLVSYDEFQKLLTP